MGGKRGSRQGGGDVQMWTAVAGKKKNNFGYIEKNCILHRDALYNNDLHYNSTPVAVFGWRVKVFGCTLSVVYPLQRPRSAANQPLAAAAADRWDRRTHGWTPDR